MRWGSRPRAPEDQRWDWSLIVIVIGFLLIMPIPGAIGSANALLGWVLSPLAGGPDHQFTAYEEALAAAALKRPDYAIRLTTIPSDKEVEMVNFGPALEEGSTRNFNIWAARKDELQRACSGASDPVLALQQVLGLPPQAAPERVVNTFLVPRDGLFRPCVSDGNIDKPYCGLAFSPPPPHKFEPEQRHGPHHHKAKPRAVREAYGELLDAYSQLHFVADQMWQSYRVGFIEPGRSSADYPHSGYPFTGMGWTYNWSPSSPTPFGVTEFVVKKDAAISEITSQSPAEFCAAAE